MSPVVGLVLVASAFVVFIGVLVAALILTPSSPAERVQRVEARATSAAARDQQRRLDAGERDS